MTCHEHEAALVELARNVGGADSNPRLLAHLQTCAACAARLEGERALSGALRVLATAADAPPDAHAEQRILEAFDTRFSAHTPASRSHWAGNGWWLAAAASLVIVGGGWWNASRSGHRAGSAVPATRQAAAPAAMPAQVDPTRTASPLASADATSGGTMAPRARTPARPAPRATAGTPPEVAEASDAFIQLPMADRLPTFESGTIVRVELDVSSLPAYGLPIMPDAPRTPVTADVIVGQDGQPRAIRLVSMETAPRRRQ